MTKETH